MKRISLIAAGAAALAVIAAGPAQAWDCLLLSGSEKGMQQKAKSDNWEYFTFGDFVGSAVEYGMLTAEQADCARTAWEDAGFQQHFALGTGVAGAKGAMSSGRITESDFFVLAKNAPVKVLANGKGVDTLEAIILVQFSHCFDEPPGGEH